MVLDSASILQFHLYPNSLHISLNCKEAGHEII